MIPVWVLTRRGTVYVRRLATTADGQLAVPYDDIGYVYAGQFAAASWHEQSEKSDTQLRVKGWEWASPLGRGRERTIARAVASLLTSLGFEQVPEEAANPGLFEVGPREKGETP